nr:MAG TPA: hypothetical protein [Bacteriophage sp.]
MLFLLLILMDLFHFYTDNPKRYLLFLLFCRNKVYLSYNLGCIDLRILLQALSTPIRPSYTILLQSLYTTTSFRYPVRPRLGRLLVHHTFLSLSLSYIFDVVNHCKWINISCIIAWCG